jgi:glutaminyl-tRNA synthetase
MAEEGKSNFIRTIIDEDNESGKFGGKVQTRFPPEPNGYLHIGHAKSICLNFGIAQEYQGICNLRFDDTNPLKEEQEYIDSIKEDVRWLGFQWNQEFYASDYFEQLYDWAIELIKQGKAYVDDTSAEEMREMRGSLTAPGKESPYRMRSIEENLDLFERMRAGEFKDGEKVLRAKVDMTSPNINLRDPVMYRILHATHPRTRDKWCIYPTYDWAHGQSDSIEGVTHSICTLEFEDHRPLYDWYLDNLGVHHPRQIEFARLDLTRTVMSKRKLLKLVTEKYVDGWDDPRMPTLSGIRRRGVRPEALRTFADVIGVAKNNSTIDVQLLEHTIREDLDPIVPRVMSVLDPLKMVIDNFPNDREEVFTMDLFRHDGEQVQTREVPLTREVYIERDDFMEDPPPKYFRLALGVEVRLMGACLVTATEVVKDSQGNILEVHCTYDPESIGGQASDGRRVKGTIHWVSAKYALTAEVRLYDYLLSENERQEENEEEEEIDPGQDFMAHINQNSKEDIQVKLEPFLARAKPGERYQFMRKGYFYVDPKDSSEGQPMFNQIVGLRDSWAKIKNKK